MGHWCEVCHGITTGNSPCAPEDPEITCPNCNVDAEGGEDCPECGTYVPSAEDIREDWRDAEADYRYDQMMEARMY